MVSDKHANNPYHIVKHLINFVIVNLNFWINNHPQFNSQNVMYVLYGIHTVCQTNLIIYDIPKHSPLIGWHDTVTKTVWQFMLNSYIYPLHTTHTILTTYYNLRYSKSYFKCQSYDYWRRYVDCRTNIIIINYILFNT